MSKITIHGIELEMNMLRATDNERISKAIASAGQAADKATKPRACVRSAELSGGASTLLSDLVWGNRFSATMTSALRWKPTNPW